LVNVLAEITCQLEEATTTVHRGVAASLVALVEATHDVVAPHLYRFGQGPAVVIDIGAHKTTVEVVAHHHHHHHGAAAAASCAVLPSVVGRSSTSYRGFRRLSAPGVSVSETTPAAGAAGVVGVVVGDRAEQHAEEYWLRHTLDNDVTSHSSQQYNEGNERLHVEDVVHLLTHACTTQLQLMTTTTTTQHPNKTNKNTNKNNHFPATTTTATPATTATTATSLLACHPVVLIDSFPPLDNKQRADMVLELFETFHAPSVAVVPHAVRMATRPET
jgi:hypothetical protein